MRDFHYRDDAFFCEDVPLERIAKERDTPCYVYSHATLTRHFHAFDRAFAAVPHVVAFAVKANSNLAVLQLMASCGSGADIVSGGELFRALHAGIPPNKIVFVESANVPRKSPLPSSPTSCSSTWNLRPNWRPSTTWPQEWDGRRASRFGSTRTSIPTPIPTFRRG